MTDEQAAAIAELRQIIRERNLVRAERELAESRERMERTWPMALILGCMILATIAGLVVSRG